jgi:programmed cell death protein 5
MDNLQPAHLDPSEIPEGFSAGPNMSQSSSSQAATAANSMDEQQDAILAQVLTPDAFARLRRIKLVKKAKAEQVEKAIVQMAMSGKLPGQISEDKLIELLERGNRKNASQESSSISIQRKNYAMDSDEEADDDDMY